MDIAWMESRPYQRSRASNHAFILVAIVLLGGAAVFALGLVAGRPITFPDETIYAELARNLAAGHGFDLAGAWTYGPIYPLLLAPIFWLAPSIHDGYLAARAFNAVAFASAAVPLWLIGRRFVTKRTALLLAAGGIALPASVYSTKLQTESVAYPVTMWTVLATLAVLARPTRRRQLLLLACLIAAPLVRFELLALTPSLLVTCLVCTPGPARARVRRLWPLVASALSAAVCVVLFLLVSAARGTNESHGLDLQLASLRGFVTQLAGMVAALDLHTGILPFALLLVVVLGLRRTSRIGAWAEGDARVLSMMTLLVAISLATVGSVYLAGIPAVSRPPAPPDRYLLYVVPLILILFARWIEHGAPRLSRMHWGAALAAGLPLIVAATQVHGRGLVATSNALSFMPWMFLRALTTGPWWLLVLAGYCAFCATVWTRARGGTGWLIQPVVSSITLITLCAFAYVSLGSWQAREHTPPGGWLDAHAHAEVVAVWINRPTSRQAFALWEINAMNRNLGRVYYLRQPDTLGPATKLVQGPDGTLLDDGKPVIARYALTSWRTPVVGRLITRSSGLALYRIKPPLRVATLDANQ
jgi:hypothetical protein